MPPLEIARLRLYNQQISQRKFSRPAEVVACLGAMQAQDYTNARWAVGLRCVASKEADVEQAVVKREILRTWLLRGTLHLVSPSDVHWFQRLISPRLISGNARRNHQLELDESTFSKSFHILTKALEGGKVVTRPEILETLERAGISTIGQRGYHILGRAALEGLICFGPQQGKKQTFVLLDEWASPGRRLERDEALAELAERYFASHGPASLADFTWWSGLTITEARMALDLAKAQLIQETLDGQAYWLSPNQPNATDPAPTAYLLPAFDEYFLAYADRSAILNAQYDRNVVSSNGVFRPMIVIDGQVVGIWKQEQSKRALKISLKPFTSLSLGEKQAISAVTERYGVFKGLPVILA